MRRSVLKVQLKASAFSASLYMSLAGFAHAQSVTDWATWTLPTTFPYTTTQSNTNYAAGTTGSVVDPQTNQAVSLTVSGEINGTSTQAGNSGGTNWSNTYYGGSTATSSYVSTASPTSPAGSRMLVQTGFTSATYQAHTLNFSQNVTNAVLGIWSLGSGSPSTVSQLTFTQPFVILSQNGGLTAGGNATTGYTLTGYEGDGVIQFLGTYNSISWDVTAPEYYSAFSVGLTTLPNPQAGQTQQTYSFPTGTLPPPLVSDIVSSSMPTGGWASSNLGSTVNPRFDGGTLDTGSGGTVSNALTVTSHGGTISAASGAVDFTSAITNDSSSSGGAVTIAGTGHAVTFSAANGYSGNTIIQSGGQLDLAAGGSVASSRKVQADGTLDVSAAGATSIQSLAGANTGSVNLGSNALTLTNAGDTYAGAITGQGSVHVAGGTETLTGANSYSGGTSVGAGAALTINSGAALGTGAVQMTGSPLGSAPNPAVLNVTASTTIANNMQVSGDPTINVTTGTTVTYTGAITDGGTPGDLVVNAVAGNTGTLLLAPSVAGSNTYTGGTFVDAGTLQMGAANALPTTGDVSVLAGATFDLNGFNTSIGALSGAGVLTNAGSTLATLTNQGASSTFSGTLQDGTAPLALVENAPGNTLTLSGANTYTGGTTVAAGTLAISGAGTLGATSAAATVSGGTLDLGATTQTQDGGVTLTGGTIQNGTLSSSGTFALQSGTVSADLSGAGPVAKTTSGTVTLSGANTYTGATDISAGTLALTGTGAIASSSLVTSNGTFDISGTSSGASITSLAGTGAVALGTRALTLTNANATFSGAITGSGALTVAGGTETLTGANTGYSGTTTVNAGATLAVNAGAALGTGSLSLAGISGQTATLQVASTTSIAIPIAVAGDPTFNIAPGTTATVASAITGTGNVVVDGGGTLALSNAGNTYSGGTQIANGSTLQLLGSGVAGAPYTGAGPAGTITSNTGSTGGNLVIGDAAGATPATIEIAGATANAGSPAQYKISSLNAVTINPNSRVIANTGGAIGALTTTNSGILDLTGSSTLAFATTGNYVQTATGTLAVDISSTIDPATLATTQSSSTLTVNGNASLGGALAYTASAGQYSAGQKFDVLNYSGALSGAFASFSGNLAGYTAAANYGTPGKVYLVLMPNLDTGPAPATTAITSGASGSTALGQQTSGTIAAGSSASPVNAASGAVLANLSQAATGAVNQIGSGANLGAAGGLLVANVFSATQGVGSTSNPGVLSSASQSNVNEITATGSGLGSGGTASGAAQLSANAVNSLAVTANGTTTGTIQQELNQVGLSVQKAGNSIVASAGSLTTPASVSGSQQTAQTLLNGSNVTAGSGSNLGLTQSLGDALLALDTTNTASATGSSAALAAQVGSQVSNVGQTAAVQGNLLSLQSSSATLTGGQNSTLTSSVSLGNSAAANSTSGAAAVSAPTQSAELVLNSVQANGAVTAGAATSTPFQQNYQDVGHIALSTANGTTSSGGVNGLNLNQLSASSANGAASISATSGAPAQAVNVGLNSVSSAATLGGSLLQTTAAIALPGLANAATVSSTGAAASLVGLNQSQSQIVNQVGGAGAASGLKLAQETPAGMPLSAVNVQTASATLGNVTASGAAQTTALGANIAALGSLGAANLLQNASAGSFSSANALNASGVAATIQNAVQTSATQTNIIR